MSDWVDSDRGRAARERCIRGPVPEVLPLLDAELDALLRRWTRNDAARRGRAALLKDAGPAGIECAEALCEKLLRDGWIVRRERLVGGAWQWESIAWRDLPRLQGLLGVSSARQRGEERQSMLARAGAWFEARRDSAAQEVLDPDLLSELERALAQLGEDKALRPDLLAARLDLLQAIAAWHDMGQEGTRRDFALRARGTTKALTDADWRWLEAAFDLDRLRIARFTPVVWLAGDLVLEWDGGRQMHSGPLHFAGLTPDDLCRTRSITPPRRWWLLENRASFERQAQRRAPGVALVWMPGRPPAAWRQAVAHLVQLAPAPAWISADADPAGVDIALSVAALWQSAGLAWQPHQMGVPQWEATSQHWPLNEHDHRLLDTLLQRRDLPSDLRALCEAMRREGRKAEQEAWV